MTLTRCDLIRSLCRPMAPFPTSVPPSLQTLTGIRAVLFDVYGTLLVSASGDIDAEHRHDKGHCFSAAVAAAGIPLRLDGALGAESLAQGIRRAHGVARATGIEYPEVDIREIWRESLGGWFQQGLLRTLPAEVDVERAAVEYELRVNPVWPMANALACLRRLRDNGYLLGLVSNAQFYTAETLAALLEYPVEDLESQPVRCAHGARILLPATNGSGPNSDRLPIWLRPLAALGVHPQLQFYSYEFRQAKPGSYLYKRAAAVLGGMGVSPQQAIYVGNDMLNDMWPAAQAGFRTALFAGDTRSLRLRQEEDRLRNVHPTLILTDLLDLASCLPATLNGRGEP